MPPAEREFLRGRFNVSLNEDDAALAHFSKSIELDPKSAKAYVARGELRLARRNCQQALQDFSRALELEPQSASAYTALGRCHLANKEWTKAIAELTRALILNPGESSAYAARGFAYLNTGDYAKAIADKDLAIQLIERENEEMRRAVEPYLQEYRSTFPKDDLLAPQTIPDDRINAPTTPALLNQPFGRRAPLSTPPACAGRPRGG
jgi:tetratricopeptide (TPR) repeat protein